MVSTCYKMLGWANKRDLLGQCTRSAHNNGLQRTGEEEVCRKWSEDRRCRRASFTRTEYKFYIFDVKHCVSYVNYYLLKALPLFGRCIARKYYNDVNILKLNCALMLMVIASYDFFQCVLRNWSIQYPRRNKPIEVY